MVYPAGYCGKLRVALFRRSCAGGVFVSRSLTSGSTLHLERFRISHTACGPRRQVCGKTPPPKDGELGAVVIGVSSQSIINRSVPSSAVVEHPPYLLTPSRAASQSIGITLTPNAPEEIVRDAFDLKLNCLWSFEGCHRWNELLPAVEPLLRYN